MENECFGCGCTETKACTSSVVNCHWLVIDNVLGLGVCSNCPEHIEHFEKHQKEIADFSLIGEQQSKV